MLKHPRIWASSAVLALECVGAICLGFLGAYPLAVLAADWVIGTFFPPHGDRGAMIDPAEPRFLHALLLVPFFILVLDIRRRVRAAAGES